MKESLSKELFFSMTLDFLEVYIPQVHNSKRTRKTYRDGLTVFRRYVTDVMHLSLRRFTFAQCTFEFVLDYRNWLLDVGNYKRSTVNNRLAALKAYVQYAASREISLQQVYLNVAEVPFLKLPRVILPIIENSETLKAFLDAPPNTRLGCRDTLRFEVAFFFSTIHGVDNRMSERNVERIVKKYADIVRKEHPDLPPTVYPHMLRRTRGTGLYRDGVPIEAIAVAMGHASTQTTKDHYAFPSLEQKKAVMDQGGGLVISKADESREWPDDDEEIARLCGLR